MLHFFKVQYIATQCFEEAPTWTKNYQYKTVTSSYSYDWGSGTNTESFYEVKTYEAQFFKTKEDAEECAKRLRDRGIEVKGIFHTNFDDNFIERAHYYTKRINDTGEFSFETRKRIRNEMRCELIPRMKADKSNKQEVFDKKAYLRAYC